jgi:hypothetical protein
MMSLLVFVVCVHRVFIASSSHSRVTLSFDASPLPSTTSSTMPIAAPVDNDFTVPPTPPQDPPTAHNVASALRYEARIMNSYLCLLCS